MLTSLTDLGEWYSGWERPPGGRWGEGHGPEERRGPMGTICFPCPPWLTVWGA